MKQQDNYVSTRNNSDSVSASEAIVRGLSPDGGLYVPAFLDSLHFDINKLYNLSYIDLTKVILEAFLPDFKKEEIADCVNRAYTTDKFDTSELVKVKKIGDVFFTELWHGPTSAFKDMALTLLPYLLTYASKKTGEENKIVILTATSGDTGKAALEGFKDVENTEIVTFYPKDGVSLIQERQMLTTEGKNTHIISVEGNFDDTQNGVKEIFNDLSIKEELKTNNYILSSANSINIGRLLPQIVYYYYSYFQLVRNEEINLGETVDFIVPSGNFGDILAGYYAKKTGLPIAKLICASNKNKILTDFFKSGIYDTNREFYKTSSPSMDILISSNLERLLYDALDKDSEKVSQLMKDLQDTGKFSIDLTFEDFLGDYADENEVFNEIKRIFQTQDYLIDPHTAVGSVVAKNNKTERPQIILSTANPYKFSNSVYRALYGLTDEDAFTLQKVLEDKTGVTIPKPLASLKDRKILHDQTCSKEKMDRALKLALGVKD